VWIGIVGLCLRALLSLSFAAILMIYSDLCSNLSRPSDFREPSSAQNDDTHSTSSASFQL